MFVITWGKKQFQQKTLLIQRHENVQEEEFYL